MTDVKPLKIRNTGRVEKFDPGDILLSVDGYKVTSTKGLGAVFEKSQIANTQIWPASVYTEVSSVLPATGYLSIYPSRWVVPARGAGGGSVVRGTVRFYFSDGTTVDRINAGAVAVTETRDAVSFGKDGLTITKVGFGATNTAGVGTSTTIGPWSLDGGQT